MRIRRYIYHRFRCNANSTVHDGPKTKPYFFSIFHAELINNVVLQNVLSEVIINIEVCQQPCDNHYKEVCDVLTKEGNRYQILNISNIIKVTKPYWNKTIEHI